MSEHHLPRPGLLPGAGNMAAGGRKGSASKLTYTRRARRRAMWSEFQKWGRAYCKRHGVPNESLSPEEIEAAFTPSQLDEIQRAYSRIAAKWFPFG